MPKMGFIELAETEVRILWLERSLVFRRKLTPVKFDRIPLPAGVIRQGLLLAAEGLTAALIEYVHGQGMHRRGKIPAFLVLPWQQGFARGFRLPWFPPGKRKQALSYFIEEETPISGGEVLSDFLIVEAKAGKFLEVLVGAVKKSTVAEVARCFDQAGFRVEGVDLAVSALSSVLPLKPGEDVLYLNAGEQRLEMAFFRGRRLEIVRTFSKYPGAAPDLEPFRELERTLFYYATQHPDFSLKRICCSDQKASRDIGERVRQSLGPSIEICAPFSLDIQNSKCREAVMAAPAAWASSMRLVKAGRGLNLWRQEEEKRKARQPVVLWTGALLALLVSVLYLWLPLQVRATRLEEELALLRPQGLKAQKILKEQNQLAESWAKLQAHPVSVGDSLAAVEGLQKPGLTLTEIEYKEGGIFLHGLAGEAVQVEELMRKLKEQGWGSPVLSAYRQGEGAITFTLGARQPRGL